MVCVIYSLGIVTKRPYGAGKWVFGSVTNSHFVSLMRICDRNFVVGTVFPPTYCQSRGGRGGPAFGRRSGGVPLANIAFVRMKPK